jgi:UDP-N-acetylglucosamine 2-epimerase
MNNIWIEFANARKLIAQLQLIHCGQHRELESNILEDFFNHPLYNDDIGLHIHYDDFECVTWLQAIISGDHKIPR